MDLVRAMAWTFPVQIAFASIIISIVKNRSFRAVFFWAFIVLIAFQVGFRAVNGDSEYYFGLFSSAVRQTLDQALIENNGELETGYVLFNWMCAQLIPVEIFFTIIAFFYLAASEKSVSFFVGKPRSYFVGLLTAIYPFFFGYAASGVRQAIALAILLFIPKLMIQRRWISIAIYCGIGFLFHRSVALAIFALILYGVMTKVKKPLLVAYVAWVAIVVLAALNVWQGILGGYLAAAAGDVARYQSYTSTSVESYIVGLKPNFIMLSILPMILGYKIEDSRISKILLWYTILNGLAMACSFMPFYDRFLAYSWTLIPLILALISEKVLTDRRVAGNAGLSSSGPILLFSRHILAIYFGACSVAFYMLFIRWLV